MVLNPGKNLVFELPGQSPEELNHNLLVCHSSCEGRLTMKGTYLGEFEEIVLLTVAVLHEAAYGNAVKQEVEKRLDRTVNLSAIHAALYRLEEKGFLHAEMGEATKRRGGKRKKYFTITAFGLKTLETSRSIRNDLWKAIPKIVFDIK